MLESSSSTSESLPADNNLAFKSLTWTVAALFVIPFFWYRRSLPLPSFYGEWSAIFLGFIALLAWLAGQRDRLSIPYLAFVPIGLALLIGLQLAVLPDLVSSHVRLGMVYLLFSAAMMTASFNAKPWFKIETLAIAILAGCLLNCGHDWYAIVFGNAKIPDALGQKNNYSDYLMLGVISLCYLHSQKRLGVFLFLLLLAPLVITAATLARRTVWCHFLVLVVLTLITAYKSPNRGMVWPALVATGLFSLTSLLLPHINSLLPHLGPARSSLTRLLDSSANEFGDRSRLWIWKSAWQMALDHPWLGVGYGNFDWTFFTTKADYADGAYWGRVEHAHNIFLQLFAELGITAPLIVLIGLASWLKSQYHQSFSNRNWWLWNGLAFIGVHSLLEYPLWYAYLLAPFAVLLGITPQRSLEIRLPNSFRLLGAMVIVAAGLASANLLNNYLRLESFIIRLSADQRRIDPSELDAIARQDAVLRPYTWPVKASLAQIDEHNAAEWLPFFRQANHFIPYPDFVLKEIIALKLTGNDSEAEALAKTLSHAFPEQTNAYLNDSDLLKQMGTNIAGAMRNALPRH